MTGPLHVSYVNKRSLVTVTSVWESLLLSVGLLPKTDLGFVVCVLHRSKEEPQHRTQA